MFQSLHKISRNVFHNRLTMRKRPLMTRGSSLLRLLHLLLHLKLLPNVVLCNLFLHRHTLYCLQKHLYIIKLFSDKFPNNGQLIGAFKEFEDRISELTYEDFKHSGTEINVLIALVVDILKKNPKVTEVGTKLLSVLLSKIHYNISFEDWVRLWEENKTVTEDYELKLELIISINQKLSASMYHSYLEIWL